MGAYFNASFERERKENMTQARILQIARGSKEFRVSLRYRDRWLRRRCHELKVQGLLVGGRRHARDLIYYPAVDAAAETW